MASRNCFSNCLKTHGFLCIFPSNEWRNYVGPQNTKNDEIVLSCKAVLPDVTGTFTSPPYLLSFLFLLMHPGRKIPIRSLSCPDCHLWLQHHYLPAGAKILLSVIFQISWEGLERGSQESQGGSSKGHALWKERSRSPYERFSLGLEFVSLCMSDFNNFWNFVYIPRKGCNKSSLTLLKSSCSHPSFYVLDYGLDIYMLGE